MDGNNLTNNDQEESLIPLSVQNNIPLVDNNGKFVEKYNSSKHKRSNIVHDQNYSKDISDADIKLKRIKHVDKTNDDDDDDMNNSDADEEIEHVSQEKQTKTRVKKLKGDVLIKSKQHRKGRKKDERDNVTNIPETDYVSIGQTNYFKMTPNEFSPLDDQENFKPSLLEKEFENISLKRNDLPELVSIIKDYGLQGCSDFSEKIVEDINEYINTKPGSYFKKKISGYGGINSKIHPFPGCSRNLDMFFESYVLENVGNLPLLPEHFDIETIGDCYASIPLYDESDPFVKMSNEIIKMIKTFIISNSKKLQMGYDKFKPILDKIIEFSLMSFYTSSVTNPKHVSNFHRLHSVVEKRVLEDLKTSPNLGWYHLIRTRDDHTSSLTMFYVGDSCENPVNPISISSTTKSSNKTDEKLHKIKPTLFDYESIPDIEPKLKSKLKSTFGTSTSLEKTSTWIYYKPNFSVYGEKNHDGSINLQSITDIWDKMNKTNGRICSFSEFFNEDRIRKIMATKKLVTLVVIKLLKLEILNYAINNIISNTIESLQQLIQHENDGQTSKNDTILLHFTETLQHLQKLCTNFYNNIESNELSFTTNNNDIVTDQDSIKSYKENKLSNPRRFFKFHKSGKISASMNMEDFLALDNTKDLSTNTAYSKSFSVFGDWTEKSYKEEEWHEMLHENENVILKNTNGYLEIMKPKLKTPIFPDTYLNTSNLNFTDDNTDEEDKICFYWYGLQFLDNIWDIGVIKSAFLKSDWLFVQCTEKNFTLADCFFPLTLPKRLDPQSLTLQLLLLSDTKKTFEKEVSSLTTLSSGRIQKCYLKNNVWWFMNQLSSTKNYLPLISDNNFITINSYGTTSENFVVFYYVNNKSNNKKEEYLENDDDNTNLIQEGMGHSIATMEAICICDSQKLMTEKKIQYIEGCQLQLIEPTIFFTSISQEPTIYPETYLDKDTKKVQLMFKQKNKYMLFFVRNLMSSLI